MRLLCLQQVDFEGPASLAEWAEACGHQLICQLASDLVAEPGSEKKLPDLTGFDGLILLGGPMNIYQEAEYPWLAAEKQLLRDAVARGMPVLGICLGAQLLADVLGAPTTQNRLPEIGWFPLHFSPEARQHTLLEGAPEKLYVMQWHSDTFALPEGAVAIGHTEACANQGFIARDNLVGLQGHLEWTPVQVETLLKSQGEVLSHAAGVPTIQSPDYIRQGEFVGPNIILFQLCDRLFGQE